MKKAFSVLLACAFMAMAFAACGGAGGTSTPAADAGAGGSTAASTPAPAGDLPDEIIIGGLAPLTGAAAFYGNGVTNGAMLAVEEINAAGGILGKQINYVKYDEQGDPTEAINAYNRLVNTDGIIALMGDVTTGPTMAVAQKAAEDKIPMITPTGTGAKITEIGENIFRACFTDPFQGELMADYAFNKLGAKSVGILYETGNDYSAGIADAFEAKAKELGMEVTDKESYPTDTTDFNAQLTKLKAGNPDVIMAPGYYEAAALITMQASSLGIESTFIGPDGWDGVLKQVGEGNANALEGFYYCSQYSSDSPGPELQAFMDKYRETYGEDENMFAVLGYEAIYVLKAAIESAGSVDSDAIVAALKTTEVQGLTGKIAFNGGNDPARDAYIITFEDGVEKVLGTYSIS